MTVPSLPAAQSAGVAPLAWANDVVDLLQWLRDDRPILKVRGGNDPIVTGTTTEVEFSDGFGTFPTVSTPIVNVGGFTPGTSGDVGVYIPETGLYEVSANATWSSDPSGVRTLRLLDGGATIPAGDDRVPALGSSTSTTHSVLTRHYFTAGDELGVSVTQNSGGNLDCTVYLEAKWVGSSIS